MRNHRGQKASQLARLSGHAELAAELGRSRRRQGRPQRAAAEGLEAAGAPKRSAEAVLTVLIQVRGLGLKAGCLGLLRQADVAAKDSNRACLVAWV